LSTFTRRAFPVLALAACAIHAQALAGDIQLTWDAVPGASGYHVYYGTQSGIYGQFATSTGTSTTITGLQDCQTYFVAVKAFNSSGESQSFSNELSGWPRPTVSSATPSSAFQGDQIVIDISGANFQPGASVDFGNPHVVFAAPTVVSCSHIQLVVSIEPTAKKIRPAKAGKLTLEVSNPDAVFGQKSNVFEVLVNPARFDINQSDPSTKNRIDGKDTVYLASDFGISEADPNYDPDMEFDGDGWVDGNDLAYIASNLGRCWAPSSKTWTTSACPTNLQ